MLKIKKIAIRVDSSQRMGSGHLMRCLNLAESLRSQNIHIFFISRELPGNNIRLIINKGFTVFTLPYADDTQPWQVDANQVSDILDKNHGTDCLLVDHYDIDASWEKSVRPYTHKIMVIDDIANRNHDCDLLLDQNFNLNPEQRYKKLVPARSINLFGPHYALLKNDYYLQRKNLRNRSHTLNRVLISFGNSDVTHETRKAIQACLQLTPFKTTLDVIVGSSNPHQQDLQTLCSNYNNIYYYTQVDNMANLMHQADLAIGAGGITTWERCCLGLPSIVMSIAKNQEEGAKHLAAYGAIHYLGTATDITIDQLSETINQLRENTPKLQQMSELGKQLVDGYGCTRVAEAIISLVNQHD